MIRKRFLAAVSLAGILAGGPLLAAEEQNIPGQPVSMVVTVEPKRGKQIPPLAESDISVNEAGARSVSGFKSLRGSSLQLMFLIDDSSRSTFDTEIPTIKQWITALPSNTQVAVAYMRNGMAQVTQNFTSDHTAAAKGVRVAMGAGGADVSPYDSLSDAIKKWPQTGAERREVVMVSSGIEGLGGGMAPENPYVNKGIADAQRAGIVVYTIYNPSAGHEGHSLWRVSNSQNFLSQLSDETGGEAYITTFGSPVSFAPYLESLSQALQNQFRLTFVAKPENKSGLQSVKVRVKDKDADVAAADKVFVKAST